MDSWTLISTYVDSESTEGHRFSDADKPGHHTARRYHLHQLQKITRELRIDRPTSGQVHLLFQQPNVVVRSEDSQVSFILRHWGGRPAWIVGVRTVRVVILKDQDLSDHAPIIGHARGVDSHSRPPGVMTTLTPASTSMACCMWAMTSK